MYKFATYYIHKSFFEYAFIINQSEMVNFNLVKYLNSNLVKQHENVNTSTT